jgi:hypothetical protein
MSKNPGERGDEGESGVGDPSTGHRGLPPGIGLDQFGAAVVLLEQHRRLAVGRGGGVHRDPVDHLGRADVDQRLGDCTGIDVDQHHLEPPRDRGTRRMTLHLGFARLLEQHRGEAARRGEPALLDEDRPGALDLGPAQRGERMADLRDSALGTP